MSKSNKEAQDTGQQSEKMVTKYDLKMQRRKEEKEKELRDKRAGIVGGILLVAVLACIVASFPIRTWLTVNGTYIKVGGENISRVEFDYNYNITANDYISRNYYLLYYMGMDLSGDLSKQMYSDTLTWQDYFEQCTVENIAQSKGLAQEAQKAGFVYDTAADYQEYIEAVKKNASDAGISTKEYLQRMYGVYATESRIKSFVEESLFTAAYVNEIAEQKAPTGEEIQAYYEENKDAYDSVDYYYLKVDAELPTEPTELADPVEPKTEGENGSNGTENGSDEEEPYQPSEAEIEAAMKLAKTEADQSESKIAATGELMTNVKRASSSLSIASVRSWLFEEGRKPKDTTVIEDTVNHCYYVLGFENRYLDQALTTDLRVVVTAQEDAQAILDEWKNGAATEESFAELCEKYTDPNVVSGEGGLLEGVAASALSEELKSWITDSSRKAGDTAVISPEDDTYTYVMYYVAPNEAEWYLSIRNTLMEERVNDYLTELIASVEVEDPKGYLAYLKIPEEDENPAESTAPSESDAPSESTDPSESTAP